MKFELIEIHTLETHEYNGVTHDLEVEEDHSYNIDGVIVHNSVCTTRKMTGVGYPQLSAIAECADAAHGVGGHICADGGCTVPGDIAKAFGAGADFVMLGGLLGGHLECSGQTLEYNGKTYMEFYGMSSKTAQEKHAGGVAEYRASEGRTVRIPYKGPVDNTIKEILGGLRSACTYVGAKSLKDLPKCASFITVNRQLNQSFDRYDTGED